ncbi:MAG: hypothetical protein LBJ60_07275 [Tannerellaceae bacterium]|nr:hypothetical protein [Tannerellaceae bacterium]
MKIENGELRIPRALVETQCLRLQCLRLLRGAFLGGAGRGAKREPLSEATREGLERIARNEPQASEDLQRKARPPLWGTRPN